MKPFFRTQERKDELFEVLESWEGTPYRHHSGVKYYGVDCAFFIGSVLIELGIVESFRATEYARDFCLHSYCDDGFAKHLREHPVLEEVGFKNPMDGDIVLYKFGRVAGHSAFYFDRNSWQARSKIGVVKLDWSIDYNRLTYGFRVMEK